MPSEKAMQIIDEWAQDWPDKLSCWDNSEARLRLIEAVSAHAAEALADYKRVVEKAHTLQLALEDDANNGLTTKLRGKTIGALVELRAAIAELKEKE